MQRLDGYRILKPTREADHFVTEAKGITYAPADW